MIYSKQSLCCSEVYNSKTIAFAIFFVYMLYIFRMYFAIIWYICYILTHHALTYPIYPSD